MTCESPVREPRMRNFVCEAEPRMEEEKEDSLEIERALAVDLEGAKKELDVKDERISVLEAEAKVKDQRISRLLQFTLLLKEELEYAKGKGNNCTTARFHGRTSCGIPLEERLGLPPENYSSSVSVLSPPGKQLDYYESKPKVWAWVAALIYLTDRKPFCGATLVSYRHVITAAHCVVSKSRVDYMVRLGEYDFNQTGVLSDPIDYQVKKAYTHDEYRRSGVTDDIAILTLHKSTDFNCAIWRICLPSFVLSGEPQSEWPDLGNTLA
ncbi:unnamed protein product, partial [Cyprideis torosa]